LFWGTEIGSNTELKRLIGARHLINYILFRNVKTSYLDSWLFNGIILLYDIVALFWTKYLVLGLRISIMFWIGWLILGVMLQVGWLVLDLRINTSFCSMNLDILNKVNALFLGSMKVTLNEGLLPGSGSSNCFN